MSELKPSFGDGIENGYASEDNPTRRGFFVRAFKRTGRMNPGLTWEITDGAGKFWEVQPAVIGERLTVIPAARAEGPAPVLDREGEEIERPPMSERGLLGQIMDAAWPEFGGNHLPVEWWETASASSKFTLDCLRSWGLLGPTPAVLGEPSADALRSGGEEFLEFKEALDDLRALRAEHLALNGGGPGWMNRWLNAWVKADELFANEDEAAYDRQQEDAHG